MVFFPGFKKLAAAQEKGGTSKVPAGRPLIFTSAASRTSPRSSKSLTPGWNNPWSRLTSAVYLPGVEQPFSSWISRQSASELRSRTKGLLLPSGERSAVSRCQDGIETGGGSFAAE